MTRCAEYHFDPLENQMTASGTNDSRQQEVRDHDYKKVNDTYPDYFADSLFRQTNQSKESAEQIRLRQESRTKKDSNAFFDFHKSIYNKHGLREESEVSSLHYQTYLSAATDIEVPFNPHFSE